MKDKEPEIGAMWINCAGLEKPWWFAWDLVPIGPFPKHILREDGWQLMDKGDPEGIKKLNEKYKKMDKYYPKKEDVEKEKKKD